MSTPTKPPKTDRRELTESERYRIIGRWEAGQTVGEIGRKVGRPTSTIARLVNKFQKTGQVKNMPGRGAKQKRRKGEGDETLDTTMEEENDVEGEGEVGEVGENGGDVIDESVVQEETKQQPPQQQPQPSTST